MQKRCRKGHHQWIRKDADIDNHVIVPNISVSYTQGFDFVEKYTASLATSLPLDPSLPSWRIHVLNYKWTEAEASVILKIHHWIGYYTSLMSLFSDCTTKSCHHESMPTIPHVNRHKRSRFPRWNVIGTLQELWGVMVFGMVYSFGSFPICDCISVDERYKNSQRSSGSNSSSKGPCSCHC